VKLSEYQAMCVALVQEFGELRRLRAAVRAAEAAAVTSPTKLARKLRKKRGNARLQNARQYASRGRRRKK
jgi:hypothetical protein